MNRVRLVGLLALLVVLLLAACGSEPTPDGGGAVELTATVQYQMAEVRTSTPTPGPASPTPPPPDPTATPVRELAPAPTAEVAVLTVDDVQRINVADAKAKADAGEAILVDTRAVESYAQLHVAGAVSVPLAEMSQRLGELPADKQLIFYCA